MPRFSATTLLILLLAITCPVLAEDLVPKPFSLEGFFILEDVTNFSGGNKTGSVFNGVYHPILNYNFAHSTHHASGRIGLLAIANSQPQFAWFGLVRFYPSGSSLCFGSDPRLV